MGGKHAVSDQRNVFMSNLKALIEEKGINQMDISKKLDISPSTVSEWVSGKKYPRADKMQMLADMLCVQVSDLTREQGQRGNAFTLTSEDERMLLDLFRRVPEERRQFVVELVRTTLNNL
jgi:transcriptional regulator with XRE-family HTH domain